MSNQLPPIPDFPERLPAWDDDPAWTGPPLAKTGLVEVTEDPLDFTPVPRLRVRRNGWTEETQRLFIAALAECGCVSKAARAVGMTARTAYRLLETDGADSFAAAWDQAIARGIERLREVAFDRAFNGGWVPVYRRGKLVRVEHRRNDRLGIALLSGRNGTIADNRERAASRHRHRLFLKRRREEEAAGEAAAAERANAGYQAELERRLEIAGGPAQPRVRML